jgi:hypothetical protein
MRAVELAKVAAAAEALRLRRLARRQGMRAAFGAGAAVFAIAVFVLLHVVFHELLIRAVSPLIASLILFGVDLVVTAVLGFLAMRNTPDDVEREALAVRRQAVLEMRKSVTVMAVASEVGTLLVRRRAQKATTPNRASRAWIVADLAARLLARRRAVR